MDIKEFKYRQGFNVFLVGSWIATFILVAGKLKFF